MKSMIFLISLCLASFANAQEELASHDEALLKVLNSSELLSEKNSNSSLQSMSLKSVKIDTDGWATTVVLEYSNFENHLPKVRTCQVEAFLMDPRKSVQKIDRLEAICN